jgi:teichuronic acid biosynthesis glycosyltransferase TuaC
VRVLFVCREILFYGVSPIMARQAEGLVKSGVEVDYFTIKGKGFLAYFKAIPALKHFLKTNKQFDILHAHYGLCGLAVTFAAKKEKTIISFMGSELIGDPFPVKVIQNLVLRLINNRCIRKFDSIIVKSRKMSQALKGKAHHVIPNGVCLEDFYPTDKIQARKTLGYNEEKKLVIFIADPPGRPEKNFELADSAMKLVNDPGIELKCLCSLTKETLNLYYSAADMLLLTSLHEGSPNVIKEAMACGCPLVSTDVGDVRENISGVDGCYVCTFDPHDVAAKIKTAVNFGKTEGRRKLLQMGLDTGSTNARLKEVYQKLINAV